MDKNKIIILALIIIIAALLIALAAIMPNMSKQDTNLKFKSNSTLTEGDSLKIKLTDANGTAIANQTVNITITGKDGSSDYHSVVTNEKGVGSLKLDKSPGKYNVTVSYGGNDKYNGCDVTKKVKIEKKVAEVETTSSTHSVYAYKSDGTPMYSQQEVSNYVLSKYGAVNYHIQDNGYINLDDAGYTDDGAKVVQGGVRKDGKTYERSYYENYIMGK